MRPFRFRIWNKVKKHWTNYGINLLGENVLMGYVGWDVFENKSIPLIELNDLVVTQYTGINDSEGKEIYEGDLIEIKEYSNESDKFKTQIYEVIWMSPFYYAKSIEDPNICNDLDMNPQYFKVVGNIFENPELLK
jgi:uncharacterized phage protein (TIGR01671 family)